jgi:hypothetical protein
VLENCAAYFYNFMTFKILILWQNTHYENLLSQSFLNEQFSGMEHIQSILQPLLPPFPELFAS